MSSRGPTFCLFLELPHGVEEAALCLGSYNLLGATAFTVLPTGSTISTFFNTSLASFLVILVIGVGCFGVCETAKSLTNCIELRSSKKDE